jgi:hypothetical protein
MQPTLVASSLTPLASLIILRAQKLSSGAVIYSKNLTSTYHRRRTITTVSDVQLGPPVSILKNVQSCHLCTCALKQGVRYHKTLCTRYTRACRATRPGASTHRCSVLLVFRTQLGERRLRQPDFSRIHDNMEVHTYDNSPAQPSVELGGPAIWENQVHCEAWLSLHPVFRPPRTTQSMFRHALSSHGITSSFWTGGHAHNTHARSVMKYQDRDSAQRPSKTTPGTPPGDRIIIILRFLGIFPTHPAEAPACQPARTEQTPSLVLRSSDLRLAECPEADGVSHGLCGE